MPMTSNSICRSISIFSRIPPKTRSDIGPFWWIV
jgi:hypothetical protein